MQRQDAFVHLGEGGALGFFVFQGITHRHGRNDEQDDDQQGDTDTATVRVLHALKSLVTVGRIEAGADFAGGSHVNSPFSAASAISITGCSLAISAVLAFC